MQALSFIRNRHRRPYACSQLASISVTFTSREEGGAGRRAELTISPNSQLSFKFRAVVNGIERGEGCLRVGQEDRVPVVRGGSRCLRHQMTARIVHKGHLFLFRGYRVLDQKPQKRKLHMYLPCPLRGQGKYIQYIPCRIVEQIQFLVIRGA